MNRSKILDYCGQNIYASRDTHLKSWRVSIIVGEIPWKTFSQDPSVEILY